MPSYAPSTNPYILVNDDPTNLPNGRALVAAADSGLLTVDGGPAADFTLTTTSLLGSLQALSTTGGILVSIGDGTAAARQITSTDGSMNINYPTGVGGDIDLAVVDDTSLQKAVYSIGGSTVGVRKQLNLIAGPNVGLSGVDNAGLNRVDITIGANASPQEAYYILQRPNAALYNAQSLINLSGGLLKNTLSTGVLTIGVPDVDYQSASQNLIDISALSPTLGRMYVGNGSHIVAMDPGSDGYVLTSDAGGLVWSLAGSGAPVNATYITQTPDVTLFDSQALSLNATGLMKSTTGTGVVTTAVQGTDYWKPGGTPVNAASGGTGQSAYTTGDTLYASGTTALSKLGIGTTGQVQVVSSGVPSWSNTTAITGVGTIITGTWNGTAITTSNGGTGLSAAPASGALLYGSGGSTLSTLAPASDSNILTLSSGVPAWEATTAITALGTVVTGTWDATPIAIAYGGTGQTSKSAGFNALSPLASEGDMLYYTSSSNAALAIGTNGFYLGSNGTDPVWVKPNAQPSCRLVSTSNLVGTYNNGAGTITVTATGQLTIDGVNVNSGDRILVAGQSTTYQNGIYTVTTTGVGPVSPVLTRATNYNAGAQIAEGDYVFITEGTVNAATPWVETGAGPFTIGTTPIVYSNAGSDIAAGTGLTKTGNTLSLTNPVAVNLGGTSFASYTTGDMLYASGSTALSKVGIGTTGQVLSVSGGIPAWENVAGGVLPSTATGGLIVGTGVNTYGNLAIGATGQILEVSGGTATWQPQTSITSLGTITTGVWNGTTIAIANGGTGQTTQTAAFDALSPLTTTGDTLYYNGTHNVRLGLGTANQAYFTNSGATAPQWGTLPIAGGGTGQTTASAAFNALAPATSAGGLILATGSNAYGNLGIGVSGTVLTSNGTTASWADPGSLTPGSNYQVYWTNGSGAAVWANRWYQDSSNNLGLGDGTFHAISGATNSTAVGYHAAYANVAGLPVTAFGSFALSGNTSGTYNIGIGYMAGAGITTGAGNTVVGNNAMLGALTGASNVGFGDNTLQSMTSGTGLTALGAQALQNVTTGTGSTAVGYQAGFTAISGALNLTALGYQALKFATGTDNTAIGYAAGAGISSGNANVCIGNLTMQSGTATGSDNVVVGYSAGNAITSGDSNTLIGYQAGKAITSGSSIVAVGLNAAQAATVQSNIVAIGNAAAFACTTGAQYITAVGIGALENNSTATNNIGVGYQAGVGITTGTYNVAIGDNTLAQTFGTGNGTATKNILIGYQAGLGMTSAASNVCLGYNSGSVMTTAANNVAIGEGALAATITDGRNVAVGINALTLQHGINYNTAVGYGAGATNVSGQLTAFGYNALNLSTGASNNAFGYLAGSGISTGSRNMAFGDATMQATCTGSDNIMMGISSGAAITSASYSVGIGSYALQSMTTNGTNTCVGYQAGNLLSPNPYGSNNVMMGYQAGSLSIGAGDNVFIGASAGKTVAGTTGNGPYYNVFIGSGAGNGIAGTAAMTGCIGIGGLAMTGLTTSAAVNNTAVGQSSGTSITSGSHNTCIGASANVGSGTLTNATAIGDSTTVAESNQVALGNGASVFISNYSGTPATPTGGGVLYVSSGSLFYIGSSGNITLIASA